MKKYFITFTMFFLLAGTAFFYYHKYTTVKAEFDQYKTEQQLAKAKADKVALQKSAVLAAKMNKLNEDLNNALSDNSSLTSKLNGMRESNASYKAKLNVLLNTFSANAAEGKSNPELSAEFIRESAADAERADNYAIRLNDMLDRYAVLEKYAAVCIK